MTTLRASWRGSDREGRSSPRTNCRARASIASLVFDVDRLAIGAELAQLFACLIDVHTLALQVVGDGATEAAMGDEVRGVGLGRQVAARQLMLALRTGFDAGNLVLNGKVDGLIVAHLEVQAGVLLDGA